MRKFILIAAVAALAAPDAEACVAGRARGRQVSRTRTVQQTCVKQAPAVSYVPVTRVVESTVLKPTVVMVPTKIQSVQTVMTPIVQAPVVTRTTESYRATERVCRGIVVAPVRAVRGVVAVPLRVVGGVLQALPCPGCR